MFVQRVLIKAEHASNSRRVEVSKKEILSRATYLSDILYGNKKISSFEMVRGYTSSISGLPQSKLSEEVIASHKEKIARRALVLFKCSTAPHVLEQKDFSKNEQLYVFKRSLKFGKWQKLFV